MSCSARAWIVAASIATVEGMKDQGFAKCNYTLRCLQQHVKNNIRSYSQAKKLSANYSSTSSFMATTKLRDNNQVEQELKQSEDSLKKVMYLNCWGPN